MWSWMTGKDRVDLLLSAWVAEIDSTPVQLMSTEEALEIVAEAKRAEPE